MNRLKFIADDIYDFLLSFDDATVAKSLHYLELLDEFGEQLRPPQSRKVAKDIYELRITGVASLRVFYTFYKRDIWILHAFVKKSQKIPQKELRLAIHRLSRLR